jgi:hypothetical protein
MPRKESILELARIAHAEVEAVKPLTPEMEVTIESDNLGSWLLCRCSYKDNCWGGVGALHVDYAHWRARRGELLPYTLPAFRAALTAEGFQVEDAGTDGPMVYGLLLRCDLVSCGIDPSQPGK